MEEPKISLIVPVYNSEKYLRRCLDSLVFQTMTDIELILVDNGSEDNSLNILREYEKTFQGKVFVISVSHSNYAGRGRNIGIQHARAKYVAFCDSDDMMHLCAMQFLYEKAVSENCDLVFCPHYRVENKNKLIGGRFSGGYSPKVQDLILSASPSVWGKLIRRDLIQKVGLMPENMSAEDVAYSFLLHTYATKIGYVDRPLYFYINRSDSEVRSFLSEKKMDNVLAQDYGYTHCNPQYKKQVIAKIGCLTDVFIHRDWVYGDYFISRCKKIWPLLESNDFFIEHYKFNYDRLKKYVALPDDPVPCIVYLSGFGYQWTAEKLMKISNFTFRDKCEVVVLDESNCDIYENSNITSAYNSGDMDFVGKYFALKFISLTGGFFIGNDIHVDAPMNYLRYFNSFWGFEDEENFSDSVFGGRKNSRTVNLILETYQYYSYQTFPTLASRIRNVMVVHYNLVLHSSKSQWFNHSDFALLSPDLLVCDVTTGLSALFPQMHFCSYGVDLKTDNKFETNDNYILIKKTTLRSLVNNANNNNNNVMVSELRRRLYILENSDSWKITAPLRNFAQTLLGKKCLLVYRFFLKIRRSLIKRKG